MTTLDIFDVGHGQCALLTCEDGQRVLIDCGHDASKGGWTPASYLQSQDIKCLSMLVSTNYDEDHVSGLPELLRSGIAVDRLLRNRSVAPDDLLKLKSEDGMGRGIGALSGMMRTYTNTEAPRLLLPNVEYQAFHLRYPDFEDENNLSLVFYVRLNNQVGFLFPGDLETKGWSSLLAANEDFRNTVSRLGVLVASHHGRESGKSETLFTNHNCKPYWIVISDKGYEHETQETIQWYGNRAIGAPFDGRDRSVLTTRSDGHLRFVADDNGWRGEKLTPMSKPNSWHRWL